MKVKYFLRGLGMGIVFSALLLTATGATQKETLTEEEIRVRASLLGMVDPGEETPAPTETSAPTETPATDAPEVTETPMPAETPATDAPEVTETPMPTETPATEAPEVTETPEATETPEPQEEPTYVTVTIQGGMWSGEVARAMAAAGLVSSAAEFDEYLCENGYASSISTGSFRIRVGADYYEIAEAITK